MTDSSRQKSAQAGDKQRHRPRYARVTSAVVGRAGVRRVEVEVSLHPGLPYTDLVGIPAGQATACRTRVRAALRNLGFLYPDQRIVVSVTPPQPHADASVLDLPLALALLEASDQLPLPRGLGAYGELTLLGDLQPTREHFALGQCLTEPDIGRILCPMQADEGGKGSGRMLPFANLSDLYQFLARHPVAEAGRLPPFHDPEPDEAPEKAACSLPPLADLPAQRPALDALRLAAAGRHGILLLGGPGSGKTFLASLLVQLLPDLEEEERRELRLIYSAKRGGERPDFADRRPPFRHPHPGISSVALLGGGQFAEPGEISLAHRGVLFLDELAELPQALLDMLRVPMGEGEASVIRQAHQALYPADFIFVAAANPCPCGQLLEADGRCRCRPYEIRRRISRFSGPFAERIELFTVLERIPPEQLRQSLERSERLDLERERIFIREARERQRQRARQAGLTLTANADWPWARMLDDFAFAAEALACAEQEARILGLSVRGYRQLLACARTAADLAGREEVSRADVLRVGQYRHERVLASLDPDTAVYMSPAGVQR
ncbi:MAG: ATP-binding protein [Bacillota bacterium]|nr:ATP-binding protein [Bacillota bacterium]